MTNQTELLITQALNQTPDVLRAFAMQDIISGVGWIMFWACAFALAYWVYKNANPDIQELKYGCGAISCLFGLFMVWNVLSTVCSITFYFSSPEAAGLRKVFLLLSK